MLGGAIAASAAALYCGAGAIVGTVQGIASVWGKSKLRAALSHAPKKIGPGLPALPPRTVARIESDTLGRSAGGVKAHLLSASDLYECWQAGRAVMGLHSSAPPPIPWYLLCKFAFLVNWSLGILESQPCIWQMTTSPPPLSPLEAARLALATNNMPGLVQALRWVRVTRGLGRPALAAVVSEFVRCGERYFEEYMQLKDAFREAVEACNATRLAEGCMQLLPSCPFELRGRLVGSEREVGTLANRLRFAAVQLWRRKWVIEVCRAVQLRRCMTSSCLQALRRGSGRVLLDQPEGVALMLDSVQQLQRVGAFDAIPAAQVNEVKQDLLLAQYLVGLRLPKGRCGKAAGRGKETNSWAAQVQGWGQSTLSSTLPWLKGMSLGGSAHFIH